MLELWEKLGENILKFLTPCILTYFLLLTKLNAHRKIHNSIAFYQSNMFRHYCAILREFLHQLLKPAKI